ncbi:MAG: 16S rRNA (cytosine(967)-C(5))-methyltransferase RsmB [Aerococcus sp.]|nr:16S rRNA (cytosine(967)-C(5))-methyltransferase RsmB [Aerococcus sp.]
MTHNLTHTARYQAMQLLSDVVSGRVFINEGLASILKENRLPDSEHALFTQLVYGTMQYHFTVDEILKSLVKRPNKVKRWVWELLALSSYQYFYLDHIPQHAIVNEAVKIAKTRGNQTLSRFVNGVLRNLMRQFETIMDAIDHVATDDTERICLIDSLPIEWFNYFEERFGREEAIQLAESLTQPSQVNVRINQTKNLDITSIISQLQVEGYQTTPSTIAPTVLKVASGNPAQSQLFKQGVFTIQDEAASLAVSVLNPMLGECVLDACAAPGGKTVQIAEAVGKKGHVEALDMEANKLPKIQANVERMGVREQVAIHQQDARQLDRYEAESFDRILVDAPCSGIGLFRRKPDTKYHKALSEIKGLPTIQLEILEAATPLLKKGGHFVYSTCTITAEENEQVVKRYLKRHPEMELIPIEVDSTHPLHRALTQMGTLEILPHYFQSDGFFIAHMKKRNDQSA